MRSAVTNRNKTKNSVFEIIKLQDEDKNDHLITQDLYNTKYFDWGFTIFHAVVYSGKLQVLKKLLTKFGSMSRRSSNKSNSKGQIPNSSNNQLKELLDVQDFNKETSCHIACNRGNIECLMEQIKYGAIIAIKNKSGLYPMALFLKSKDLENFKNEFEKIMCSETQEILTENDICEVGSFLELFYPNSLQQQMTLPDDDYIVNSPTLSQYKKTKITLFKEREKNYEELLRFQSINASLQNKAQKNKEKEWGNQDIILESSEDYSQSKSSAGFNVKPKEDLDDQYEDMLRDNNSIEMRSQKSYKNNKENKMCMSFFPREEFQENSDSISIDLEDLIKSNIDKINERVLNQTKSLTNSIENNLIKSNIGQDVANKESYNKFPTLAETNKYYKKNSSINSNFSENYDICSNLDTYNSSTKYNKLSVDLNTKNTKKISSGDHQTKKKKFTQQVPLNNYYKKDIISMDDISDELFGDTIKDDEIVINVNNEENYYGKKNDSDLEDSREITPKLLVNKPKRGNINSNLSVIMSDFNNSMQDNKLKKDR